MPVRGAQTLTVTLGPFFLSLATEGPGSKRKTTEPTMRAAAKSTFILRSERRSIHRQQQERSRLPGPEKGVDAQRARRRPDAGWTRGRGRSRSARSAPRSPCAATPSGRRRRGRGCGWLPRYSPLIGHVKAGRGRRRWDWSQKERLRTPACLAARPAHPTFRRLSRPVKASRYQIWRWSSKKTGHT